MADPAGEYLSAAQAAQYLGLHRSRVYQLLKAGLGRQVAGYWVFTKAELDAYRAAPKSKGGRPKRASLVIRRARAMRAA